MSATRPQRSLTSAYELWLESWETALAAVAIAARSRTLSTSEAAAHQAVIAEERKVVGGYFTLLLHGLPNLGDRHLLRRGI